MVLFLSKAVEFFFNNDGLCIYEEQVATVSLGKKKFTISTSWLSISISDSQVKILLSCLSAKMPVWI